MNNTALLAFIFSVIIFISGCGASAPSREAEFPAPSREAEFHSVAVSPIYHPPTVRRKSISATGDQEVIDNRQLNMQIYNNADYPIALDTFLTLDVGESVSFDKYASILTYFRIIKQYCDGFVDIYPSEYTIRVTKCDYL